MFLEGVQLLLLRIFFVNKGPYPVIDSQIGARMSARIGHFKHQSADYSANRTVGMYSLANGVASLGDSNYNLCLISVLRSNQLTGIGGRVSLVDCQSSKLVWVLIPFC